MSLYLSILYVVAFSVLVSAGIGFAARKFVRKYLQTGVLPFLSGSAVTLLLGYFMMSFFRFGFYSVATAGLAFLVYVLFIGLWHDQTGRFTRWAGISASVILVAGLFFLFLVSSQKGADQTYLLPMGFEGCVLVNYEVEGAPPLKIEDNEIVYHVPEDGIIDTSSPMDFGWVSEEHSGSYRSRAFYVDQAGNTMQELPQEKIRFGANGSMKEEGKPERTYYYQLIGDEDVLTEGCPALEIPR